MREGKASRPETERRGETGDSKGGLRGQQRKTEEKARTTAGKKSPRIFTGERIFAKAINSKRKTEQPKKAQPRKIGSKKRRGRLKHRQENPLRKKNRR